MSIKGRIFYKDIWENWMQNACLLVISVMARVEKKAATELL